jgi:hypothetical protein
MKTNYEINKSDSDYKQAVNYDGTNFYNYPMTITIENVKYIIPFGTSDRLTIKTDPEVIIIGENSGLNYIGCIMIDTNTQEIIQDVFIFSCSESEMTRDIFDLEFNEQLQILNNYML